MEDISLQGTDTYPLGKGKSSSKMPAGRGYVSSQEGVYIYNLWSSMVYCILIVRQAFVDMIPTVH